MEEDPKVFLTINTTKGLYRYNRLIDVFRVASAPAIWKWAMEQVLLDVTGTLCYLDDIVVTGSTDVEHLANLRQVLKRLEEYGLCATCTPMSETHHWCGSARQVSREGPGSVKDPSTQDVSQLRSFLGFVSYYHRFLPNLTTVLHCLIQLLQLGQKKARASDCAHAITERRAVLP